MALKVKDIADKLKVSPATVSLVLNNKPGISEETRQRVLKAVEEMGYSTNLLSKPAINSSRNIRFAVFKKHGRVVSDTPFFSALVEGIDGEARANGYNLVISYINGIQNNIAEILRTLRENSSDGLILLATEMDCHDLEEFKALENPLLILDSYFEHETFDTVVINNEEGAYLAANHIIEMGHSVIGYLGSSVFINNFGQRRLGFLKALEAKGISFDKKHLFEVEPTLEGSHRDMLEFLSKDTPLPTVFFADNDIIAFGAIKALKEKGLRVPEDVSVVGFDDMPFCEIIEPSLTTMRVYKQEMGRLAVKRLLDRVSLSLDSHVKIEVGTDLVERKSVIRL